MVADSWSKKRSVRAMNEGIMDAARRGRNVYVYRPGGNELIRVTRFRSVGGTLKARALITGEWITFSQVVEN